MDYAQSFRSSMWDEIDAHSIAYSITHFDHDHTCSHLVSRDYFTLAQCVQYGIELYFLIHMFPHTHIHTKMDSNEDFSWFPIECDDDAELSLLVTYLKITPMLNQDVIESINKCSNGIGDTATWWERYESDYYPEISAIYDISGESKFNVS